ncbi:MAG: zinc transport system permease protein [Archaeoglobi archaeon]|nr:zinc transport system permease protein [Archaeoglobi archaeon]
MKMIEILQDELLRNAVLSLILLSALSGTIGSYVVSRRVVMLAGGIAHSAFGGVALGILIGVSPFLTAIPFSIVSAVLMGLLAVRRKGEEDVAIAVIWTLGMSLAVIFMRLSSGYTSEIASYLFGTLVAVSSGEVILMSLTALLILLLSFLFHREFEFISFDDEFAKLSGVPTEFFFIFLLSLTALSVVVLMKSIGILLMIASLSVPPAIAKNFSRNLREMMFLSFLISLNLSLSGLLLSYLLNMPPSAMIAFVISLAYLVLNFQENFL